MEEGVERSIGRLEGKLDLVIDTMTELKAQFISLEAGRLSKLESTVAGLVVKVGLVAAAIPIAIELLTRVVFHF